MDKVVEKIFELAKQESASASECKQAIIRAGQIAQAYAYADSDLLSVVFRPGLNDVLENDGNPDSVGSVSRRH
jgi:hypothetical protein